MLDNNSANEKLSIAPSVFAVKDTYHIMVSIRYPSLVFVRIGDEEYYDESNGIMCSQSLVHRVIVPMEELDKAGKYNICVRPIIERKPYFSETEPLREYEYNFYPVPDGEIRAYHISDAHNLIDGPLKAAKGFGDIDFLILNGDVINHSGDPSKFENIYIICSELMGGTKPVIFSRGNHDMRGNYAEKFAEYTPNSHGNTYYTFRLGRLWGVVLDCGEDKPDDHPEYGFTVACHRFRTRQTEFLKQVICEKEKEYEADGVDTRLVICHNPFTRVIDPPFNIEQGVYSQWAELLREYIKPDLMICGHFHDTAVWEPGGEQDSLGQPCNIVIGSDIDFDSGDFTGCGYIFGKEKTEIIFTDSKGNIGSPVRVI
ncbi:MAG: metallophosphoesterase [Clostridia bacterium]|nr:metallophosphoesterase [Clostridia bacterium]